jgi:hypothetical protein
MEGGTSRAYGIHIYHGQHKAAMLVGLAFIRSQQKCGQLQLTKRRPTVI